jgi:hypothetical protein
MATQTLPRRTAGMQRRHFELIAEIISELDAEHREKAAGEIGRATKLYFTEHEKELIKQAWEHPVANEQRPKGQMIVEFRNGRWVKSIDVGKLFEDYLKEYPEDRAVKTKVCYDE